MEKTYKIPNNAVRLLVTALNVVGRNIIISYKHRDFLLVNREGLEYFQISYTHMKQFYNFYYKLWIIYVQKTLIGMSAVYMKEKLIKTSKLPVCRVFVKGKI